MSEVSVERSCLVFLAPAFFLLFFFFSLFINCVFVFFLSTHHSFLLIYAWSTISIPPRHFAMGLLVMIMYIDTKKVSKLGSNGGVALDFCGRDAYTKTTKENEGGRITGEPGKC